MKMKTIFEIPTIENPRIDVSHVFYCVFLIFAVTAAAAADAADRTEKLPLLGVVLLKMNHHTKNQPDPLINVATAPFLGFWVPRLQMCHKITPPLHVMQLITKTMLPECLSFVLNSNRSLVYKLV